MMSLVLWKRTYAAVIWMVAAVAWGQPAAHAFSSQRASFSLSLDGYVSAYRVRSIFLLPGERLFVDVLAAPKNSEFELASPEGAPVSPMSATQWHWLAPEATGVYRLSFCRKGSSEKVLINVFVMVPYRAMQSEKINGYPIGEYPSGGKGAYLLPRGFIEVTRENENMLVSPHFQLNQFLCKQDGEFPKYLMLTERLLQKLEMVLEKVNEKGFRADTFHVMSGYRTPHYNQALGNVTFSRHMWGDAADVFIDESPRDGVMDDLNHDGRVDIADAMVLRDVVDEMERSYPQEVPVGGVGVYEGTGAHGPFVHIDARGFSARWMLGAVKPKRRLAKGRKPGARRSSHLAKVKTGKDRNYE